MKHTKKERLKMKKTIYSRIKYFYSPIVFRHFRAFTLAETLIVIGIIGVVAALTLPNLNSSTGDKEKVTKLQKVFQNLSDAHDRAVATYGPVNTWFLTDNNSADYSKRYMTRLSDFLKLSKDCAFGSGCFAPSYKDLKGSNTWNIDGGNSYYKILLADNTSITAAITDSKCDSYAKSPNSSDYDCCGYIMIDLDGPNKGASTYGKDRFAFDISTKIGIYPYGSLYTVYNLDTLATRCFDYGGTCTAWVIYNGNMDYLKADRTGRCPDGKTILNMTTNTSCN